MKKFSKGEAIRFGWNTVKSKMVFFIGILIMSGLISVGLSFVEEMLVKKKMFVLFLIVYIAQIVLYSVIAMGLVRITLRICDNEEVKVIDIFSCFHLFFKYLISYILYGLIVLIGLILLIIPGIIWGIQFSFYPYFIVDKGLGPVSSLEKSQNITKGAKWDLFVFGLLLIGINLLGVLCLIIGLLVTIPITMVAWAFVYRKLEAQIEIPETTGEKSPFLR